MVSFRGTHSQTPYCAVVWMSDVIHDCAKHAYGRKMTAFLGKHHCRPARRTLATVFHAHFAVNVSSVATAFPGTAHNQLGAEFKFTQLAETRSAGGIDDLLRDGHRIPGSAGTPPKDAVYGVYPLDTSVDVLYAWYRARPGPRLRDVAENHRAGHRVHARDGLAPRRTSGAQGVGQHPVASARHRAVDQPQPGKWHRLVE